MNTTLIRMAAMIACVAAPTANASPLADCPEVHFKVYFERGKHDLNAPAIETVAAAVSRSRACTVSGVRVEGHTDRSGARAYNIALSAERANAVRRAIIAAGIPESLVATIAMGEARPDKDTGDGVLEPLNRQTSVEFSFR